MNYLGLILDGRLSFEDYFSRVARRTEQAALSLSRLMPNMGRPGIVTRRLFAGVIASIALYASPVWVERVRKGRTIRSALRAAERRIAGRIICSYKTVSHAMCTALAGTPPLELTAEYHAETYFEVSKLRSRTGSVAAPPDEVRQIRERGRLRLLDRWRSWISVSEQRGNETLVALRDCLPRWVEARIGLTYRATQILTGHGCFGRYLRRIGKETTERCWHCVASRDTASHTLVRCPAWAAQRASLRNIVGSDLSMGSVIRALLSEEGRGAFLSFAERVMSAKEASERIREGIPAASGR
ncbi:PREDICTED: uncharacterized protein LOC108769920 [Trachymyrmex cornetzi]|uniref:uncharacterized protein LOC108769920 n=1 Tax=Trachymyrmex cornetzi TaxID=471704 RepID=UPI00084EFF92|nr:PREDICTED: uncharacterized protein LOC108769920 [Trachymyrmex cornetzi]